MEMYAYCAAMVGCYSAMQPKDKQALLAWESQNLGGPNGLATSDWPGWDKFIGPKPSPLEREPKSRAGWLYVVEGAPGLFKIGISRDVARRVMQLQTANPTTLRLLARFPVPDARSLERDLHARLTNRRVRNEWFQLSPEDVQQLLSAAATASNLPEADQCDFK